MPVLPSASRVVVVDAAFAEGPSCLSEHLDTKRRHHAGVGDDLDLGDGVAHDAEGEHRPGPPARSPHRPGVPSMSATLAAFARPARAIATARAPRTSGASTGRSPVAVGGGRFHGGAIGPQDGVGVEQGDERLEVPLAGGGQESLDHLLLAAPVSGGHLVAALDAPPSPAGQLAGGGRRAVDDRARCPRTAPRTGRGARTRGAPMELSVSSTTSRAGPMRVGEDRFFFGAGELRARAPRAPAALRGGSGGSGASPGTPATGRW